MRGRPFRGEWLLRAAMRLLPADLRRAHADEMLEAARADHAAHPHTLGGRLAFWASLAGDLGRAMTRAYGVPSSRPHGRDFIGLDVRVAVRSLWRTPGASLLVIATLALGIGLSASMYSLARAVLFAPLPYANADSLVYLSARRATDDIADAGFAAPVFKQIQSNVASLGDVAAYEVLRQNLTGGTQAEQVRVGWVSGNFFRVLGVPPAIGRTLRPDDPPGTAVLSHGAWTRLFGADPDITERTLSLDGHAYSIVGVLPADFRLRAPQAEDDIAIWKSPDNWWQNGDVWGTTDPTLAFLRLIGRLAPGRTAADATVELAPLMTRVRATAPKLAEAGYEAKVVPLLESVVGDTRTPLLLLLAAVGCVLLIACANVMGLLLVRAQGRRREIAVRVALGSSRWRVLRQLMAEALVLAVAGGSGGLMVAITTVPLLARADLASLPRLDTVSVDGWTLAVIAAIALGCTLAAGLAPGLWAARLGAGEALMSFRTGLSRARLGAGRVLVVVQVALSLVLLIGATLLATSLARNSRVDPGFDPAQLVTFAVSLPGTDYTWPEGTNRFLRQFEERLEAVPGVRSAAVIWPLPLGASQWMNGYTAGEVRAEDRVAARLHLVTPDYFETVRTPLIAGRGFGTDDPKGVVIVSRQLAERAWPGEIAVGRTLETNPWGGSRPFEVIGVAENVRFRSLREPPEEVIYVDAAGWSWADWEVDVVVRTEATPLSIVPAARAALAELDPKIPLARPREMTAYVDDQLAPGRLALGLVGLFAAVAAVLTVVGLYGVVSQLVVLRTREISIRVALGSGRQAILRWVLGYGLRTTSLGVVVGLVGAAWLTALLRAYLFEVEPTDPIVFAAVAVAFLALAALACLLPARRATRVEPIRVLRAD